MTEKSKLPNLSKILNICVTMPNMGSFIFYLIFIFLLPLFLFVIKQDNLLVHYLPLLVPLAIISQQSGESGAFSNLYPENNEDTIGLISKIMINFIAISAILWRAVSETQQTNTVYGVMLGLTGIIIIFVLSPLLIPLVIKSGDKFIQKKKISRKYNWHKYSFGVLTLIAFMILEVLLVIGYDYFLR